MEVKNILISQPEPANLEKSPYYPLIEKYDVNLTFFKFFDIVGVPVAEFRKSRIHINDYSAVIFNSKNSIDHFFRMAKELRETPAETMKYFCTTKTIALYLQNYVQYRKRKVFHAEQTFADLIDLMMKHKEERFLFPSSSEKQTENTKMLDKGKFKYTKAVMYRSVPKDLTQFDLSKYDMIALFSPIGVKSLLDSFPNIAENDNIFIAGFGTATHAAINAAGINLSIAAPSKNAPSMPAAIENFILDKEQGATIVSKPASLKKSSAKKNAGKKTKSVFTNKSKYKQMLEEKKAANAAKRKERQLERARKEAEALRQKASEIGENAAATIAAESSAKVSD